MHGLARVAASAGLRRLTLAALLVVVVQVFLGGWTATNYAALACPDFPTCQGSWWPDMDLREGFVLWRGVGVDYEGGVLDGEARAGIHLMHRLGAVVVLAVLGLLLVGLRRIGELKGHAVAIGGLLALQVALGIWNVVGGLPLWVASAHNGVAALLLASVVLLLHRLRVDEPAAATVPSSSAATGA